MSTYKIGVLGVGNMGYNHVRILASESGRFQLIGIYDPNMGRAEKVAAQFGIKTFPTAQALMSEVEAVVIAVPSSMHCEAAVQAAANGVHALVEKPLALTPKEGREISDAFEHAGCALAVGHVERFNPVVQELIKLLRHEHILAIEARRYSPFDGRITDANVVQDMMIHDIDLVCNVLLPNQNAALQAAAGLSHCSGKLDYTQALLSFQTGAVGVLGASRVTQNKVREILIHTDTSYIAADLLNRSLTVTQNTNLVVYEGQANAYRQDSVTQRVFVPMQEPLREELHAFYQLINGEESQIAQAAEANRALELCEQIIQQASTGNC